MIGKMFHMLVWSLKMDYSLLFRIPGLAINECVQLIVLKYFYYLKDSLLGMPVEGGVVSVFGRRYHYHDPLGLASLQRVYCEHYLLKRYVGESPIIVDVGAHIGQFNFFCAHYLKAHRVISVEPLPECFALLKLNALDEHDCFNMAVGGKCGQVTMHVSSIATQQSSYVKSASDTYAAQIAVGMETLDTLVRNANAAGAIDILKIDTEGSEYEILCNGSKMLEQVRIVAVEMSVLRESTGNLFKTGSLLEAGGFVLREIDCFAAINTMAANGVFERVPAR